MDVLFHRLLDRLNQLLSSLLAFHAKSGVDVRLTDGFAEVAIGHLNAPLPPLRQLFLPGHEATVEIEVLLDEAAAQDRGFGLGPVPAQVALPVAERDRLQGGVHLLEEVGITHVELVELGSAGAAEETSHL